MVSIETVPRAYQFPADAMVKTGFDFEGYSLRPLLIAGSGVVAVMVAIVLNMILVDQPPPPIVPPPTTPATLPATAVPITDAPPDSVAPAIPPAPAAVQPSFDVVRVEPSGAAVLAGRGLPGARVVIRSGEAMVGEGKADGRGDWVIVPAQPLAPGTHELTVEMETADGAIGTGDDVVVIVVPPPAASGDTPLAVKTSRRALTPSTVLQSGAGEPPGALAIETVDGSADGRLTIGGRAAPHSRVRLYLGNAFLGETAADSLGLWRFTPGTPLPDGELGLRADQMTDRGKVAARAVVPLRLVNGAILVKVRRSAGEKIVVERGDSLWQIARAVYGDGVAYTVIYDANRQQIADPDLIFPGQVFEVPAAQ